MRDIRLKCILSVNLFCVLFLLAKFILSQSPALAFVEEGKVKRPSPLNPPLSQIGTCLRCVRGSSEDLGYVKGNIIVKYKSTGHYTVTESVHDILSRGESMRLSTADNSASLDQLNQQLQVQSGKRLFVEPQDLNVSEAQALQELKRTAIVSNFPDRAQRAPKDADWPDLTNIYILNVPEDTDIKKASALYQSDPHVEYAQPNYLMRAALVPNDPYYQSSGSWEQTYDDLWGLKSHEMDLEPAWNITQGEGVVVAVVDTGLDYNHPDIAGNVWLNTAEVPGNGIDDDSNGYVDDVTGWDFVNDDNNSMDDHGHGTHCSGTIAAKGDNAIGIIGVAPEAKIMALKGLDHTGSGYTAFLADAIVYAAENGADVINNSWGCVSCPVNPLAEDAVGVATGLGVVTVFAAGNYNVDIKDVSPQNMVETITVAASTEIDEKASFSNFGSRLDISAPGGGEEISPPGFEPFRNILSLKASQAGSDITGDGALVVAENYLRQAGTSMASPHAAGLIALILANHPEFSLEEIKSVLRSSADDIGAAGFDKATGYGRINANKALQVDSPCILDISSPERNFYISKDTVEVRGTVNCRGGLDSYRLEVGDSESPSSWSSLAESSSPVTDGVLGTWDTTQHLDQMPVTLKLTATNTEGDKYVVVHQGQIFRAVHQGWPQTFGVLPPSATYSASADLDGDGLKELVFTDFDQLKTWVVRHDGTALPGWPIDWAQKTGWTASMPTLGDLDEDGLPEVIIMTRDEVYAFYADGTEVEGWPVNIKPYEANYVSGSWTNMTCTDFDGDGENEIAFTARGLTIDLLSSIGQIFLIDNDGTMMPNWPKKLLSTSSVAFDGVTAADMTGDGIPEIILRDYIGVDIYNAAGDRLSHFDTPVYSSGVGPTALGDLTNDGIPEIIFSTDYGIYAYERDGTLVPGWPFEIDSGGQYFIFMNNAIVADINLDGELEVIATMTSSIDYPNKYLSVIRNNGTLFPDWPIRLPDNSAFPRQSPVVGDVDGNGMPDIVVSTDQEIYAYAADGNVISGWPYPFPGKGLILDDFDGDAKLELVTDGYNRQAAFMLDLKGPANQKTLQWPMLMQNSKRTGLYQLPSDLEEPFSLRYTPVEPCRIVDTRRAGGIIGASTQRNFHIYGSGSTMNSQGGNALGCQAPLGEPLAAHINIIAVSPTGKGNLQAYPVGAGPEAGLSVNYNTIDTNLANAGTVKTVVESGPDITVTSRFSSAHTVIDVLGYYYPDEGFYYTPVDPCRIVDTRKTSAGIIDANSQRNFDVFGPVGDQGGDPLCPSTLSVDPEAAHINMVAVDPAGKGNLQAFPVGAGKGAGLSVNYNTIDTNLANAGTVKTVTGSGPDITVASNFSSAHTVIDVLGYYSEEEDLLYTPVIPCRIVDTRKTSAGMIDANTQRDFRVFGAVGGQGGDSDGCSSPLGQPLAAHINMVAVNPTGKGNLQAFPVGAGTGAGLSVNYNTIDTNLANAGTVKTVTGAGPDITVASNFSSAHTVIDVLGYYYPAP